MHILTEYRICPCKFDLFMEDGKVLKGVYLAKLPNDSYYRLAIQVNRDAVQVLNVHDNYILGAVDPRMVQYTL